MCDVYSFPPAQSQLKAENRPLKSRRASGGLLQSLKRGTTVQAGASEEVYGGGVDLVDEGIDGEAAGEVFALVQERAGFSGGLQREPARVFRVAGRLQVGSEGSGRRGQAADRLRERFR